MINEVAYSELNIITITFYVVKFKVPASSLLPSLTPSPPVVTMFFFFSYKHTVSVNYLPACRASGVFQCQELVFILTL